MNPSDRRYSQEHEWVRAEDGSVAVVGITEYASESLGDIVFLDLPAVGSQVVKGTPLGEVESVKAVSEIFSPITGSVMERNEQAIENPGLVNDKPYDSGWLLRVAVGDPSELDTLMDAAQYEAFLASQEE